MTLEVFGGEESGPLPFSEYSDEWPRRFIEQRSRVMGALGPVAIRIEHTGSTSVPGLAAKPIIDMLVAVPDIGDEDAFRPALEAAGYALRVREPGHRLFRTPARDVHVHLWADGDPEIEEVLMFRDWLRVDTDDRARYESLKRELIQHDWPTMQHYADAKRALIAEIKARARASAKG